MPYTNDPSNVPADQVRLLVGDTSTDTPDLTDNEIAFLLLDESDDPRRAAARAAEILAAKYTKRADSKKVGPLAITQNKSKAQEFAKLAQRLWARAGSSTVAPYAGGISIQDKNSNVLDTDRVRPAFSRRMMDYPDSDLHENSEDLHSSSEILP